MEEIFENSNHSAVLKIGKEMKRPVLRNKKNKFGVIERVTKIKRKRNVKY